MKKGSDVVYGEVVEDFMLPEFIETENVIDFCKINPNNPIGNEILESWKDHFKALKVPFVVIKNVSNLALWKRQLA